MWGAAGASVICSVPAGDTMSHWRDAARIPCLVRSCLEPTQGFGESGKRLSRSNTRRRFVTWLAMAALWLLVVAPTVSQTLSSLSSWPDLGAWCTGHGLSDQHSSPSTPDHPGPHTDKCGYCVLLGHSPLLGGGGLAISIVAPVPAARPTAGTVHRWYALPLLSAHPRGPPSIPVG